MLRREHFAVLLLCSSPLASSSQPLLSSRRPARRDRHIGQRDHAQLLLRLHGGAASTPGTAAAEQSAAERLSTVLGYLMAAGSCALYSPIIIRMLSTGATGGLSLATWTLFLVGSLCSLVFPLRMHFPLTSFSEYIALTVQSAVVLGLIVAIDGSGALPLPVLCALVAASFAVFAWLTLGEAPAWTARAAQTAATAITTISLLPQVSRNFRFRTRGFRVQKRGPRRPRATCATRIGEGRACAAHVPSARVLRNGGWSPISALLSCGGNLIRIFTTLTVTKSRLLLVSFGIGTALNTVLLTQTLLFAA